MSRTVFCKRFSENLPGLDTVPFPGAAGQDVFDNVSVKAWEEWSHLQTMLINEKHLNMMDKEARKYLNQQRDNFLNGGEVDSAEGYVAPEK
ncbi:MAG: Fe-S cluster biosynthesis and repair protein YggX [Candidatus Azotimanducaceae bacterium]|jgi:Fe-S cluster biosynthesis and repair protein YggX